MQAARAGRKIRSMGFDQSPAALVARLRAALELQETGLKLQRQNLRRRHPDASEAEIDRLFRQWLHDRPGDSAGRRIEWPRRRA